MFVDHAEYRGNSVRGHRDLGRVEVGSHGSVGTTHGPVMCYPNVGEIRGWMREASKSHNIPTGVHVHKRAV